MILLSLHPYRMARRSHRSMAETAGTLSITGVAATLIESRRRRRAAPLAAKIAPDVQQRDPAYSRAVLRALSRRDLGQLDLAVKIRASFLK